METLETNTGKFCSKEKCRDTSGILSYDSFHKKTSAKDGYASTCKSCQLEEQRERYNTNPETRKARIKNSKAYYNSLSPEDRRREPLTEEQKIIASQRTSQKSARIRRAVIRKYGGACACCGITPLVFLTLTVTRAAVSKLVIDRMNGLSLASRYRYALQSQKGIHFQILCYNCSLSKRRGKGECIHTRNKNKYKIAE